MTKPQNWERLKSIFIELDDRKLAVLVREIALAEKRGENNACNKVTSKVLEEVERISERKAVLAFAEKLKKEMNNNMYWTMSGKFLLEKFDAWIDNLVKEKE
jgi:hypothetical protein